MFDLHSLSQEQLTELAAQITAETDLRERIRVETEFIDERVAALERIAAERGETPYADGTLHLPGQVVSFAKRRWRNVSGMVTRVQPGKRLDVWEELTDPPTEPEPPADPEPPIEPTDPAQ